MLASVFIEQNASREEHINQKEKKKQKTNTFDHLHHEKLRNVRCVAAKCYMQFFHMKYALWTFIHSQPKNHLQHTNTGFLMLYFLLPPRSLLLNAHLLVFGDRRLPPLLRSAAPHLHIKIVNECNYCLARKRENPYATHTCLHYRPNAQL